MRAIATQDQHARGAALGRQLLDLIEPFARELAPDADEAQFSAVIGELLVMTVFQVGDQVERLNRVDMTIGFGRAVGSFAAQSPGVGPALMERLQFGFRQGCGATAEAMRARGQA